MFLAFYNKTFLTFNTDKLPLQSNEDEALQSTSQINIISDVTILPPFCHNTRIENGSLCFICTFKMNKNSPGVKCMDCRRVYHIRCILKQKLASNANEVFLCKVCFEKKLLNNK